MRLACQIKLLRLPRLTSRWRLQMNDSDSEGLRLEDRDGVSGGSKSTAVAATGHYCTQLGATMQFS